MKLARTWAAPALLAGLAAAALVVVAVVACGPSSTKGAPASGADADADAAPERTGVVRHVDTFAPATAAASSAPPPPTSAP